MSTFWDFGWFLVYVKQDILVSAQQVVMLKGVFIFLSPNFLKADV